MAERRIFTAAERFRVLVRDGFRCVYCGKSAVDGVCLSVAFHLDHVYPRSLGGRDLMSNIATACSDCNVGKGDSVLSQLPPGIDESVESGFARYCQRQDVVEDIAQGCQRIPAWDREVIETLLCSHDICVEVVGSVEVEELKSDACRTIFTAANAIVTDGGIATFSSISDRIQDQQVCDLMLSVQSWVDSSVCSHPDRVTHFRLATQRRAEDRWIQEAKARLYSSIMSTEEQAALLEELVAMRREAQGMQDPAFARRG